MKTITEVDIFDDCWDEINFPKGQNLEEDD